MHDLTASATDEGKRVDLFLAQSTDLSRAHIQRLIAGGHVTVNGRSAAKSDRLEAGDVVALEIPPLEKLELTPEEIPIDVRYEDDDLIVLSKPAGMVVHPAPGHRAGTLVHALLAHTKGLSGIGGTERPGIVHRLDKDTSGLMLVAKTDLAHRRLAAELKRRAVKKTYWALVYGSFDRDAGVIAAPVGRHKTRREKMAVAGEGREAVTRWRVLERLDGLTLLDVRPETGRTHQIRVHLSHIHHPVAGDTQYGSDRKRDRELGLSRQFLHAIGLEFVHPRTGKIVRVTDELAPDLKAVLRGLGSHIVSSE